MKALVLGINRQEEIPGDYRRNLLTGLMYKTLDLGLHLKSAWHLVQKMLPTETFLVRNEGDLMRNSHLCSKARKIKWPASAKTQSIPKASGSV